MLPVIELQQELTMARVPVIDERINPGKMVLNVESVGLTPEQFDRLCRDNRELRLELTARKEILIMAPTHTRIGFMNTKITSALGGWTDADGAGIAGDSNTGFRLPNGAIRAPDASWTWREKWDALTEDQQNSFAPICPDFVIELRSQSETVQELQNKMAEYIANGAQMGWLIDPFDRKVYIYQPGQPPGRLDDPTCIRADAVLPGFTLDLTRIW